jgi:hypothetical protein
VHQVRRCVGTADVVDKIRVFNALRAELEPQRRHSNRSVLSAANGQPVLVYLEGLMMRAPPVLNSGIVAMLRLSAAESVGLYQVLLRDDQRI